MLTDEFRKAKSSSILYEGKMVNLYDTILVPQRGKLALHFHGTNSEWRQGVRLGDMSPNTDLRLTVAGQTAPGMQLWEDSCPNAVEIDFEAPRGKLVIYNIWDVGNGQSSSQIMGAGMHVEVSDNGRIRIYRCNDGHKATTFDHLVFSLELM